MTIESDIELVRRQWIDLPGAALDLRPRRTRDRFVLVERGRTWADVVIPESEAGRQAAGALLSRVRELTGVSLPVVTARWPGATWAPEGGPGTLAPDGDRASDRIKIVIGSLSTNPLLASLYHAFLCPVDTSFPGPGGHYLRTLCDPWGDGVDLVIVGASRDQDLVPAAAAVAQRLELEGDQVCLDYLHDVEVPESPVGQLLQQGSFADAGQLIDLGQALEPDEHIRERARHAYRTHSHRGMTPYLSRAALAFNLTGQRRFAQQYLSLFQDMMEEVAGWDPDQWGRWGFDADFQALPMISGWHAISDSPIFSDEDRRHVAAHLLQYLGNSEDEWHKHEKGPYPSRQNHFTFAAIGLLYGALTLCRTHARTDLERRWLAMADECFRPQVTATKPAEDCESYGWLTLSHTLRYALLRPVPDYFRSGTCSRIMERGLKAMDNLGCQVPHGDARAHRGSGSELAFWRPAAWVLGAPACVAAVQKKVDAALAPPLYPYDVPRDGRSEQISVPRVSVADLDQSYCATYPEAAPVDGFDKVALRDTLSPDAPYLLIDGVGNGSHGHRDANAIVRFTSRGRIWLEDADYDKTAAHFHNAVVVTRNGVTERRPTYARLLGVTESENVALARTALEEVAGTDCLRVTALVRGVGVLVVDRVVAKAAGTYDVAALWRTAGKAGLDRAAFVVSMAPETLRIVTTATRGGEVTRRVLQERYVRADWDRYPYAERQVTVCRTSMEMDLQPGEEVVLVHLLVDRPGPVDLRALDAGRVYVGVGDEAVEVDVGRLCDGNLAALEAAARGWSVRCAPRSAFTLVDLDGDGSQELVVAGPEGGLTAYRRDQELWSAPTVAAVTALGATDDGSVIAGQAGGSVELFDGAGNRRWHRTFTAHMEHPPTTRVAFGARLGRPAAAIATESCHVHTFGLDGTELWKHELVHAATAAIAADLDGDGRDEILAGTEYWTWHCLDASGASRFTVRGVEGSGCGAVSALDTGEGVLALFGGWDGHLSAYRPGGDLAWDVALGEVVRGIQPGEMGALVTLRGGRLCCVDGRGDLVWNRRFPGEVSAVRWLPEVGAVAVAAGDGILWLGPGGEVRNHWSLGGAGLDLRPCTSEGRAGLCVRRDGVIEWLPARAPARR